MNILFVKNNCVNLEKLDLSLVTINGYFCFDYLSEKLVNLKYLRMFQFFPKVKPETLESILTNPYHFESLESLYMSFDQNLHSNPLEIHVAKYIFVKIISNCNIFVYNFLFSKNS